MDGGRWETQNAPLSLLPSLDAHFLLFFSAMRSSLDTPRSAAHEHDPLIPLRTTEEGEFVVNEPILNPNPFPTLCPSCLRYFFMESHE